MKVLSSLWILLSNSIICSLPRILPNNRVDSNDVQIVSLALHVSKLTVALSNRHSLIILNLRKDLGTDILIRNLHKNTIQTTSFTDHESLRKLTANSEQKNALFFVSSCDDILSLVFNSIRTSKTTQEYFNFTKNVISNNNDTPSVSKSDEDFAEKPPIYCVQDDAYVDGIVGGQVSNCQFPITSEELKPGSILLNRVLDHTHNLHNHTLWNFKNHLIFMVKGWRRGEPKDRRHQKQPENEMAFQNITQDYQEGKSLIPYFRFFWRFFRGQRTIICRVICFWYDPYAEKLHRYSSSEDKRYFDFSLKNFHGKDIRCLFRTDVLLDFEILQPWSLWFLIFSSFLDHLGNSLNGTNLIETLESPATLPSGKIIEDGAGLKYDYDIIVYNVGTILGVADFADFSYTTTLDFFSLTILAPRRGLMPQFLTAFKSFTPAVWWATLMTVGVFFIMLAVFQHSQRGTFADMYSETEIRTYENTSQFFTVYAYFLCGSPPTLLLGRLISGKMLFVIFSFSALIIGTAFQGAMVTLINLGVHNPDIETLDDLKASKNFIQTGNPTSFSGFFDENDFAGLENRLTTSFRLYLDQLVEAEYEIPLEKRVDRTSHLQEIDEFYLNGTGILIRNHRSILENDVFLASLPQSLGAQKNFRFTTSLDPFTEIEYHRVGERIFSYPLTFLLTKNCFLFDSINDKFQSFLGNGMLYHNNPRHFNGDIFGVSGETKPLDEEPRPFTMADVQLAFIGLVIGLFFSCLVFVAEMVRDLLG